MKNILWKISSKGSFNLISQLLILSFFFEWDRISRNYRHVVTPTADSNKFIRFYLNKGKTSADFEVVITYSSVNSFNFHHTQRLLFLLAHDDLERSNCFYQDLINDLDKKSSRGIPVDFLSPLSMREK